MDARRRLGAHHPDRDHHGVAAANLRATVRPVPPARSPARGIGPCLTDRPTDRPAVRCARARDNDVKPFEPDVLIHDVNVSAASRSRSSSAALHNAVASSADGSRSNTQRSGTSRRGTREVQMCCVTVFWFVIHSRDRTAVTIGWCTTPPFLGTSTRSNHSGKPRDVLLPESLLADAGRIPLHRDRPPGQVRQHDGGHRLVVGGQVALGDPVLREENLLGVRAAPGAPRGAAQ
jgi:hypothetical protein